MGGWEETQQGQVTQTDQRGIPDDMTSCSIYKMGARSGKGGTFGVMMFVCPNQCHTRMGSALLEMAEYLRAHQKQWMNSLICFACVRGFWHPYLTAFISTDEFFSFYPFVFLPDLTGQGVCEWMSGAWQLAGMNSQKRQMSNMVNNKIHLFKNYFRF